jgi:hypothetical protein
MASFSYDLPLAMTTGSCIISPVIGHSNSLGMCSYLISDLSMNKINITKIYEYYVWFKGLEFKKNY